MTESVNDVLAMAAMMSTGSGGSTTDSGAVIDLDAGGGEESSFGLSSSFWDDADDVRG
jgi:hypothetical protein